MHNGDNAGEAWWLRVRSQAPDRKETARCTHIEAHLQFALLQQGQTSSKYLRDQMHLSHGHSVCTGFLQSVSSR